MEIGTYTRTCQLFVISLSASIGCIRSYVNVHRRVKTRLRYLFYASKQRTIRPLFTAYIYRYPHY